jgi:hypothetical protein
MALKNVAALATGFREDFSSTSARRILVLVSRSWGPVRKELREQVCIWPFSTRLRRQPY